MRAGDRVVIRRVGWFVGASGPTDSSKPGDIPGAVKALHDSGEILVDPDFRPYWVSQVRPGHPWAELFKPEEVEPCPS